MGKVRSLCLIKLISSVVEESFVVSDKHHGLYLFEGFEDNAYDDYQARAGCRNVCSEYSVKYIRQNRYYYESYGTYEDQIIKDLAKVIRCGLARTNAGDESTLSLQVICYHKRIKSYGSIEIREEYEQ